VIEREATLGELVGPDKEKLLVLADLTTVWVLADVPEARLSHVTEGSVVQIFISGTVDQSFPGKVAYIAPELDHATRTARVRAQVPNPDMRLRPGMFARVEIAAGTPGGAAVLAIPEEAVQTVEGDPAVFVPVEGEPNTFAKRLVGIGPAIGGMVPVFAGLKEGEKYVSAGSFILKAELGKAGAAHEH
jgi:membrane fusion protein, heavy metal efflux system